MKGDARANDGVKINVIVAMMDHNNGIGINNQLPWPKIRTDYEYYTGLTQRVTKPGNVCINMKGRLTFESSGEQERMNPLRHNVVISSTLKECPKGVGFIAPSFDAAIEYASEYANAESIWVMGGYSVYKRALQSPLCHRVHLTRIFHKAEADAFFPIDCLEPSIYKKIDLPEVPSDLIKENGVEYQFEVYERR
ncbi:unnamed protein product [Owenia fusiformis]|uniref:dihydrofolate reductase n=1 Tax=Owenia fusiformis TaxID=6347 RepID=A0A8J1TSB5_OWEFU|nr:unnamed protein product [Owenia fusiformis]